MEKLYKKESADKLHSIYQRANSPT